MGILPILKDDALLPYEKVTALMDLPGVCGVFQNLRLHDQAFRMNRGPNKVQLNKLWDLLCCQILNRLRSGEVDLEPLGPIAVMPISKKRRSDVKRNRGTSSLAGSRSLLGHQGLLNGLGTTEKATE